MWAVGCWYEKMFSTQRLMWRLWYYCLLLITLDIGHLLLNNKHNQRQTWENQPVLVNNCGNNIGWHSCNNIGDNIFLYIYNIYNYFYIGLKTYCEGLSILGKKFTCLSWEGGVTSLIYMEYIKLWSWTLWYLLICTLYKYKRTRYLQETQLLIGILRLENISFQRPIQLRWFKLDSEKLKDKQSENGSQQYIDAQTQRGNEGGKALQTAFQVILEGISDL